VIVQKAGDVHPRHRRVLTELRPRGYPALPLAPKLLSAAAAAQSSGCQPGRVALRRQNSLRSCGASSGTLRGRGALNIEGLGPSTIDACSRRG